MGINTALIILTLLPLLALAQIIPASTFYVPQTGTTFSLNVDNSSQDITFHFSSPAKSWVAVGTGDKMDGSLIFFMYFNHNSSNITFSPRIATGEKEPKYAPEIDVDLLPGTGVVNGTFIANAACHNCRSWKGGSIDVTSTTQPFMYAFGPSNPLASDDLSAALVQHSHIGKFNMNLSLATGPSGLPNPSPADNGTQPVGDQYTYEGDILGAFHGYCMAILVIILTPLLTLHFLSGFRARWVSIVLFVIVLLLGLITGFFVSVNYLRSEKMNSAHHIMSLVALGLLLIVVAPGWVPHWKCRFPSAVEFFSPEVSPVQVSRLWLAAIIWIIAIISGFWGINLAISHKSIYVTYGITLAVMFVIMVPAYGLLARRAKREAARAPGIGHRKQRNWFWGGNEVEPAGVNEDFN